MATMNIPRFPENTKIDNTIQELIRILSFHRVYAPPQNGEGEIYEWRIYLDDYGVWHLYLRLEGGWQEIISSAAASEGASVSNRNSFWVVNVLEQGAVADGVTDTLAAFVQSISLLSAGGILFIPVGDYFLSDSITLKADTGNIIIQGAGHESRLLISSNKALFKIANKSNINIRDLYLYGNGSGGDNHGLRFTNCTNCKIENCKIENFGAAGIYLVTSDNNTIRQNQITTCEYGIRVHGNQNIINDNNTEGNNSNNIIEVSGDQTNLKRGNIGWRSKSLEHPLWQPKKAWVSFTFDGGYKSWNNTYGDGTDNFRNILYSNYARGTFYVNTQFIGSAVEIGGGNYADWDDIYEVYEYGNEIGSHTVLHPHLNALARDVTGIAPFKMPGYLGNTPLGKTAGRMCAFRLDPAYPPTSESEAELEKIVVWLKATGTLSGNLHAELWSDSGGPNAQVGTDSDSVDSATLHDDYPGYIKGEFTFSTSIARSYGSIYWIVLDTGGVTGAATLYLACQASQATHYPSYFYTTIDGGANWTPSNTSAIYTAYDVSSVREEYVDSKELITTQIQQNVDANYQCRAFAHTFGDDFVNEEALLGIMSYYESARLATTVEQAQWGMNDLHQLNPYLLNSFGLDVMLNLPGENVQRSLVQMLLEHAKAQGLWMTFFIHGWEVEESDIIDKFTYAVEECANDSDVWICTISEGIDMFNRVRNMPGVGLHDSLQLDSEGRLRRVPRVTLHRPHLREMRGTLIGEPVYETHFVEPAAALAATQFAQHYWTGGGVGTQAITNDVRGVMRLTTTVADNSDSTLIYSLGSFSSDLQTVIEGFLLLDDKTTARFDFGYYTDANNYLLFRFDTDVHADEIYLVGNNAGAGAVSQSTNFELSENTWYHFRIDLTDRLNPQFYINGECVTYLAHITFDGTYAPGQTIYPYILVQSRAAGAVRNLDIDQIKIWINN